MFGMGVLKSGIPESVQFCIGNPPDVHIFGTDPSLLNIQGPVNYY